MKDESKSKRKQALESNTPCRRATDRRPPTTERRDILQDEAAKYKALVETTDTGYLILDQEGKVVDANQEYVRISGHSTLTEILGRSVVEWTAEHDRERNTLEVVKCLERGFVRGLEIDYVDRHGRITPIEIQATVIRPKGSVQIISLCRDITKRKHREEAFRLSQEMLSKAFQASPDLIAISTLEEGRYIDVNNSFLRMTGHSREEVIGYTAFEINLWENPEDRNKALEIIRQQGTLKNFEIKFKTKSGEILIIIWSAELIEIKGQKCLLSFGQNITQRKQAEEALRESEVRYRTAIEQSNDGICLSKKDILYEVNLKFLEIFGYDDPSEVVGKSIAVHIDPLDRSKVLYYASSRSRGEPVPSRYEFKGLRKNRDPIDIEVSVTTITFQKEIFTLTVLRDISERKRAEESLKASEQKFRQLAETIKEVFWLVTPDWKRIYYISPAYEVVWGLPQERLYQYPRSWMESIISEDLPKVLAALPTQVTPETPIIFPDYRIKRPDSSIRWISARGFPILNESGEVVRVAGIAEDITARKEAEEEVEEGKEHLRSLMESASNFAVYRLGPDPANPYKLKVIFVSPSIKDILGISDPMNFESWFATMHPDDADRVAAANLEAFKSHKFNQSYRSFHPQKKEWRWIQAISIGVLDEKNQTLYVNGIIIDITDKKRVEEELQIAYDTLEEKVNLRTHQLQFANERLAKEIEERKLAEADLKKSEDKLRLLSSQLINAQENERKRIAIELHDELGQSLVGLKFRLSSLEKKLEPNQIALREEIKQASESIDLMTENVRSLSRDLRPAVMEHLGLFEALQWLVKDFSGKYHIRVFKDLKPVGFSFLKEQELIIFRIFQEALTNIGKHARATQVSIAMSEEKGQAVFSIKDNGHGFNPKTLKDRTPEKSGLGLTAMAERAQMAGGSLKLWSELGKGTLITFTIPLRRRRKQYSSKPLGG